MLDVDKIVEDLSTQIIPIQHRCEEGLRTVRNGKAVKQPMKLPETTPIDQKIRRVLTVNKRASRPKGTTKNGVYKNFTEVNRSPTLMSSVSSEAEVGSENGYSTPVSPGISSPTAYNPKRAFSYSGSTTGTIGFEPLPRYSAALSPSPGIDLTPGAVVAGTPLSSSVSRNSFHEEKVSETKHPEEDEEEVVNDSDLSFKVGDKIKVYKKDDDDWWEGETMDGRRGEFPGNYVK
ncbi:hypothetical protein V1506DRAFT_523022 [Lipomyces tetrasporus]